MVAGTPYQRELGHLGGEDLKREKNKCSAQVLGAGRWRGSGTWNLAVFGTRRCMGFVR